MTEKHYGGASDFGIKNKSAPTKATENIKSADKKTSKKKVAELETDNDKIIEAGKICSQAKIFAKSFIEKGMPLIDIAQKIEDKILELGGKPAFPVNLSINEIAAHYTPSFDDKTLASGLLKVDIGVHIDGFAADSAISLDLENSPENKKLIEAANSALNKATEKIKLNIELCEIGEVIEKEIKSFQLEPIRNLSGHSINQYDLHSGLTVPNYNNSSNIPVEEGLYAIEPFSTNGFGSVKDGKPSGIYHLEKQGNVRDTFAREVLIFIAEEYNTLPFCSRWIYKKFGSRGLLALRQIEQAGLLHHYAQLVETGKGIVAQAEHTILLTTKEKIITTI